jgi:hypothetical protein
MCANWFAVVDRLVVHLKNDTASRPRRFQFIERIIGRERTTDAHQQRRDEYLRTLLVQGRTIFWDLSGKIVICGAGDGNSRRGEGKTPRNGQWRLAPSENRSYKSADDRVATEAEQWRNLAIIV